MANPIQIGSRAMADSGMTIEKLDAIMDALKPRPWICHAGFRHEMNTGCLHPMPLSIRRRMRELAENVAAQIEEAADGE